MVERVEQRKVRLDGPLSSRKEAMHQWLFLDLSFLFLRSFQLKIKFISILITNLRFPKQASVQFSSVAQSCPTLCDPMDCSMLGFPVHHQLLELTQTHVKSKHQVVPNFARLNSGICLPFASAILPGLAEDCITEVTFGKKGWKFNPTSLNKKNIYCLP